MEMRDQILAEATRLFAAKGFDGTSLSAIAKAVGIRKASLLYHFASKEALRLSVLEHLFVHWQEVLPRLLKAATTGIGRFEALSRELTSFFTEKPDRARLILREALDHPEDLREAIGSHVSPWVTLVCDQIRAGQRQARVHGDLDPEAYVSHVITMVIAGIAIFESMTEVMKGRSSEKDRSARFVDELLRIARSSLFQSIEEPERTSTTSQAEAGGSRSATRAGTSEGPTVRRQPAGSENHPAAASKRKNARKGEAR